MPRRRNVVIFRWWLSDSILLHFTMVAVVVGPDMCENGWMDDLDLYQYKTHTHTHTHTKLFYSPHLGQLRVLPLKVLQRLALEHDL